MNSKRHQPLAGHWQIALFLLLFAGLSFAYSMILPLGEASDETDHFALVRFLVDHGRPPLTIQERESIGPKGDASPVYHALVALVSQHVDVSDLPGLPETYARPERAIPTDGFGINWIFHTRDEEPPLHGIVLAWHLARLVSILLGVATILITYLIALAVFPQRRYLALAAAGFVAFLPRFVIGSAVVSDDNLVIPLIALCVYFMVRITQGDQRLRTFLLLGALMGLAAIVKYHSLVLVPEMTLMVLIETRRDRWGWRTALSRWAWTMLAFLLVAAWWFVFLVLQFNQVEELGWVRGLLAPLGDPVLTLGLERLLSFQTGAGAAAGLGWLEWASLFFRSFWVSFGWMSIFAPAAVYYVLGLVTLVALAGLINPLWGFISRGRFLLPPVLKRPVGGRITDPAVPLRLDLLLLSLNFIVYLGIVLLRYRLSPTLETAQGRHLYPALTSIAFFFALGLCTAFDLLLNRSRLTRDGRPALFWTYGAVDRGVMLGLSGMLLCLSVLTPFFVTHGYYPYLPILTAEPANLDIPHRTQVDIAAGASLVGYGLPVDSLPTPTGLTVGDSIPVVLYWYAEARQERDFLVKLCLWDEQGQKVLCRQGFPVDGRYPTRAWEPGYVIIDTVYLPTPSCLPGGEYEITLSVLPVRLDTAATSIDQHESNSIRDLSLGWINLAAAHMPLLSTPPGSYDIWTGDQHLDRGNIQIDQMRQNLTVLTYTIDQQELPAGLIDQIHLAPGGDPAAGGASGSGFAFWLPVASNFDDATSNSAYVCPDGTHVRAYSFVVDASVKPGRYQIEKNNQVQDGLTIGVGTRQRDFDQPAGIPLRLDATFGEQVELLGSDVDPGDRFAGDDISITAYWQAQKSTSRHLIACVYLLDNAMSSQGDGVWTLGGHYPNLLWAPGEKVTETYSLPVSSQTPAGLYDLQLSVCEFDTLDRGLIPASVRATEEETTQRINRLLVTTPSRREVAEEHLNLGTIRVLDPAHFSPPSRPVIVDLGNQIQLLGYNLACPDKISSANCLEGSDSLHLALFWQAIDQPMTDYTVFTQLIGPDGLVWSQQDNQPQAGRYPTTGWNLRDMVVDRYDLVLPEDMPSGEYRLVTGMYNLRTGERLSAVDEKGNFLPDDAILLTTIEVE